MIENILNELRNTDNHLTYGGIPFKNPVIEVQDAINIVQEVAKEYGNGWIPVEVAMPEEHESIFAKYKGTRKWDEDGMFEKISNEVYATVENMKTGESTTTHAHTTDGKWSCDLLRWSDTYRIIAWMPLPPKYEPKKAPYQKGE